jgi:hypothetical protein
MQICLLCTGHFKTFFNKKKPALQLTFSKSWCHLAQVKNVLWCRENQFLDTPFPAFSFLKGATVSEDLLATDAGKGDKHHP